MSVAAGPAAAGTSCAKAGGRARPRPHRQCRPLGGGAAAAEEPGRLSNSGAGCPGPWRSLPLPRPRRATRGPGPARGGKMAVLKLSDQVGPAPGGRAAGGGAGRGLFTPRGEGVRPPCSSRGSGCGSGSVPAAVPPGPSELRPGSGQGLGRRGTGAGGLGAGCAVPGAAAQGDGRLRLGSGSGSSPAAQPGPRRPVRRGLAGPRRRRRAPDGEGEASPRDPAPSAAPARPTPRARCQLSPAV